MPNPQTCVFYVVLLLRIDCLLLSKTPTSLYLAMHYGLKAANYPIVDEELDSHNLPSKLKGFKSKIFGLLVTAERLQNIRTKRRPDSTYASMRLDRQRLCFSNKIFPFLM